MSPILPGAERRLRHVQPLSGPAEARLFGDRHEVAQVLQLHALFIHVANNRRKKIVLDVWAASRQNSKGERNRGLGRTSKRIRRWHRRILGFPDLVLEAIDLQREVLAKEGSIGALAKD